MKSKKLFPLILICQKCTNNNRLNKSNKLNKINMSNINRIPKTHKIFIITRVIMMRRFTSKTFMG